MTTNAPAYDAMISHVRQTTALAQAAGLLDWDQETVMPPRGASLRAEQAAALEDAVHARRTDPRLGDWLDTLDPTTLAPEAARNVTLIRRSYERATRLPAELGAAMARASSRGRITWSRARAAGRFADFAPALKEMLDLKRQEAACIAKDGQSPYDALLQDYEPGMTADRLIPLLESLRAPLSELRAAIADARAHVPQPEGHFPADRQLALSRLLAPVLGYDLDAGRIDLAVHPFCSGSGGDVRITTRIDESDPLGCIYSTIHEMGHALYEQNMPEDTLLEPRGRYASMGVHESQSRMLENQIGRSRPFADWLWPRFRDAFGAAGLADADALYRAVNRVHSGFIRTEADEVHYNLHIIMRTALERDLITGALEVDDLEDAWNTRFEADFGIAVPNATQGVLQDIHWSQGLFGYFPTYSLGNIYAAELFAAMRTQIDDIDGCIARGELRPLLDWLTGNVHRHASAMEPEALIEQAIGHKPTAAPLIAYLRDKFGRLYGL
ncbi:carboxypeptidase M32 [Halovulum dunhuangense]|uniref:Metal-dependent carboxypeptidase n=1 Tax=Halovulum dunhuangense TaxID=1505036 RepID=A0A849L639_9RHOB|nr:carboxypeptidase M32 [Halovulum dunhuangense]NNU81610.1 carboxypeptidase M32 [Halovulum dunhuangense]